MGSHDRFSNTHFLSKIWAASVSTSGVVSFAFKAPFEASYTSKESPFFSLSIDVWKYGLMFVFRFSLWAAKVIVGISY